MLVVIPYVVAALAMITLLKTICPVFVSCDSPRISIPPHLHVIGMRAAVKIIGCVEFPSATIFAL